MKTQRALAAGVESLGERSPRLGGQKSLGRPEGHGRGSGARALKRNLAEVKLVRAEVGVRRIVPVESPDRRVPEQHTATAVRLQPVLVRINDHGIGVSDPGKRPPRLGAQVARQGEISPIGGVDMNSKLVPRPEFKDGIERVDRAGGGGSKRDDHGADLVSTKKPIEFVNVQPTSRIDRNPTEGNPQDRGQSLVGIVSLR